MNDLRLLFMGTPEIAASVLKELVDTGFNFQGVITRQDKPKGRSAELESSAVKVTAQNLDIPVFQPKNKIELEEEVRIINPDLILVVAFGMIVPQAVIDIPEYGILNVHYSLLPQYRGSAPVVASILNGDKKTGVTIMKMSLELDEGNVIAQKELSLKGTEKTPDLLKDLTDISIKMLKDILPKWADGELESKPQVGEPSKVTMVKKEDGKIDWKNQDAKTIERMCRAYLPWPGVYSFWNDKKIELFEINVCKGPTLAPGQVGTVGNQLLIGTKRGNISPAYLKIEGKNRILTKDFLLGHNDFLNVTLK